MTAPVKFGGMYAVTGLRREVENLYGRLNRQATAQQVAMDYVQTEEKVTRPLAFNIPATYTLVTRYILTEKDVSLKTPVAHAVKANEAAFLAEMARKHPFMPAPVARRDLKNNNFDIRTGLALNQERAASYRPLDNLWLQLEVLVLAPLRRLVSPPATGPEKEAG